MTENSENTFCCQKPQCFIYWILSVSLYSSKKIITICRSIAR